MEIGNVEQLLEFVFTDEDFSDEPSVKEYKKLKRVMQVMVRFYERGEDAKRKQHEEILSEIKKIEGHQEMIDAQYKALEKFPSYHPKRKHYEDELNEELSELLKHKKNYQAQADKYGDLYKWGQGIVHTMHWLDKNLKYYANSVLETSFADVEDIRVSVEEYKKYKRGLDEVTYNLQESQDFFDASLDGRLHKYHEIEKSMIEAQLEALQSFPEKDERRRHVELELQMDLEYVIDNMKENPKVRLHRERMQQMHKDFYAILKWHRRKIDHLLSEEPHKIIGDVDQLKQELNKEDPFNKQFNSKYSASQSQGQCPVNHTSYVPKDNNQGQCPVKHNTGTSEYIHKLYEKNQ